MQSNIKQSVESKTKFVDFCKVCDKIESKKKKNDKKDVIKKFIIWWRNESNGDNDNFYSALRLLCPLKDNKTFGPPTDDITDESTAESGEQSVGRTAYGLKVDKLRQKYIKILNLSPESDDAKKLTNFNKDMNNANTDFGNCLYEIMSKRCRIINGKISLEEFNRYMDRIAKSYEENRPKDADEVFTELINNTTALENKWLVRIVLKDMRLGIGDNSILNAYHSDAKEYYETINNLYKVCTDLSDPTIPLSVKCIQLFSPFSPMLSERVKLKSINRLINGQNFLIEIKYDGERFQIHYQKNHFIKYFSRNCNDFSEEFNQTMSPFLEFDGKVDNCILDGEMMGYHKTTNRLVLKSERDFDVKRLKPNDERHPIFIVFDILYLNGQVLTGKPLFERITLLEDFIKPIDSRLQIAERRLSETKEEIIDAMNAAIDRAEEGIIVKLCDSVYKLNKRQSSGWIKLKPDYIDGLIDELDLLIVGGFYGTGNNIGITHFLMAVKETDENDPKKFICISRVGTGYSDAELRELQNKLNPHWKEFDRKKCPPFLQLGRINPNVWIEPKNSIVLQIRAAEIIGSAGDYHTDYTLRFPRVMKIREDKEWHQCMTFAELEQMKSRGYLTNRLNYDSDEEPDIKRRKLIERPTVSISNQLADLSEITVKSNVFEGKEFCVTPFKDPGHKQTIEKLIHENGGQIIGAPLQNKTFCIIAQNCNTVSVTRYINKYDIIKEEWIHRCVNQNKFLDWTPNDILSETNETKNKISERFDCFGDSFTQPIYETELKEVFERMTLFNGNKLLSNREIADIEFEFWPNDREFSFFRTLIILVDKHDSNDKHLIKLIESQLRFYGANIVNDLSLNTTHIVVMNKQRANYYKQINKKNIRKFHIVDQNWVQKCIESKDIVDFVD